MSIREFARGFVFIDRITTSNVGQVGRVTSVRTQRRLAEGDDAPEHATLGRLRV